MFINLCHFAFFIFLPCLSFLTLTLIIIRKMTIHKEGYATLLATILSLAVLNGVSFLVFPVNEVLHIVTVAFSTVFFLIILQFFRHPSKNTIINANQIIAPADGKVVVIEDTEEAEYFKGMRKQISIFMSPFNVHVNRNPVSGKVEYFKYHPGQFLVAWHPKASTENERTTCVVKNEQGVEVLFRQIAGALAKRIVWYVKEGDAVVQGQEFGFIKFGSRVDIFLPVDAKVKVNLEQKVTGGLTVIAEFK